MALATIESRQGKDGKVCFRAKIRLKGHPAISATFERKTDAKKFIQDTESSIRAGRYFKTSESRRRTLAELIDRYLRDILPRKPRAIKDQTCQLNWWKRDLGHLFLLDVTSGVISDARDRLAAEPDRFGRKRSAATINRYLAALSHVFTIGKTEFEWTEDNPVARIRKPKEPRGRVRFLSDNERDTLLRKCRERSEVIYLVVVIALSTGMRRAEILGLTWDDVDMIRGQLTLHETKNGERRVVPLRGHALFLMKEWSKYRHISTRLVFPNKDRTKSLDIRRPWEEALKASAIDNFRFHDLRHSAASYLVMNGASLAEIAEILGHKTLAMVKRYAHFSEAHTSSVVARMNDQLFGEESRGKSGC